MASKTTVQGMVIDRLISMEKKMDNMMVAVENLRVKAAIAGGMAGLVGTGLMSLVINLMR